MGSRTQNSDANAWEQRKAVDLAEYSKGNGYSKGDLTDAGTPIILYGRLYTKYQFAIDEVDTFAIPRNGAVYSQGNEVIVPASGETADDIARASAVEKSGVLLGGDLNILKPYDFINPLFLALCNLCKRCSRLAYPRPLAKMQLRLIKNGLAGVSG